MGQEPLIPAVSVLAVAGVTYFLIERFCQPSSFFHWLDQPNDRSLHQQPTPRSGGVGIMGGIAVGWLLAGLPMAMAFGLALLLAALSIWDDARGLPVSLRLASHLAVAGMFVLATGGSVYLLVLTALAVAWMANLFNFMDGSDGLAGGMAAIGFACYSAAAAISGATDICWLAALIATASAVFLRFNFQPARIFMGDAGSIPLGFLAATLGFAGWSRGIWPAWFPLLVFSLFIIDATVTLLRRTLRRERVWLAHREHAYQKLVRMGWSHRRLALHAYGLMLAAGLTSLALLTAPVWGQWWGMAVWILIYGVFLFAVELRWRRWGSITS